MYVLNIESFNYLIHYTKGVLQSNIVNSSHYLDCCKVVRNGDVNLGKFCRRVSSVKFVFYRVRLSGNFSNYRAL